MIILSAQISGMANSAVFLFRVVTIFNNKESNNIYFSANASTLLNHGFSTRQFILFQIQIDILKVWTD